MEVIEGTWEEIAAHAEEFNGHRLRLVDLGMIAESREPAEEGPTLAELFAGRLGRVAFLPNDVAARSEEYFAEIMDEMEKRPQ